MSSSTTTAISPARQDAAAQQVSPALPAVIADYIDAQIAAILDGDTALRQGEDPIHPTRVAIRRLRSTLRVFDAAFDSDYAAHLDVELSWYAGILGHVRDHEVQRARFAKSIAQLPDHWVLGPVAADIDTTLAAEQRAYRADVDAVLAGERYAALLDALGDAQQYGRTVKKREVIALANKATKKARRRLDDASTSTDDEALHRARKAFKRARYAAELTTPLVGRKKATRAVQKYKHVQEVLGEHQDSLVAASFLRRLGAAAGTRNGENGFTYGLLFANEQHAAAAAQHAARSIHL